MFTPTAKTKARYTDDLKAMVGLPTVSADPDSANSIQKMTELAATLLERSGLQAEILMTPGYPMVYGQYSGDPAWPTLLIYNHLDVQPADPAEWKTDPFQLTARGNVFYGRGTTDDKGPLLASLFAVEQAIRSKLPLNFKVLWETEEEIGSPNFAAAIRTHAAKLVGADSVLISDSMWMSADRPSIIYGLRGVLGFEMRLRTSQNDLHSGSCGGVAINPLNELARVIAVLTDPKTGRVTIPGFADEVIPPTTAEIADYIAGGFSLEQFKAQNKLLATSKHNSEDAVAAITAEPTLDIHGIAGGHVSKHGVKTIIPHQAVAQGSARLVPGQTPDGAFGALQTFVSRISPMVELKKHIGNPPYITDTNSPYAQAIAAAYREDVGLKPAFVREGGSIGAVLSLDEIVKAPVILTGLSLPTDGYHAQNEHFEWRQAVRGMQLFSSYFERIAKIHKDSPKLG